MERRTIHEVYRHFLPILLLSTPAAFPSPQDTSLCVVIGWDLFSIPCQSPQITPADPLVFLPSTAPQHASASAQPSLSIHTQSRPQKQPFTTANDARKAATHGSDDARKQRRATVTTQEKQPLTAVTTQESSHSRQRRCTKAATDDNGQPATKRARHTGTQHTSRSCALHGKRHKPN